MSALMSMHVVDDSPSVCVHVSTDDSPGDGGMVSLVSRRASVDRVEDEVLDRLEEFARIHPVFDPVGWTKKLQTENKVMNTHTVLTHYNNAWIIPRVDFETVQTVFSTSTVIQTLNEKNPDKTRSVVGKKLQSTWTLTVEEVRILHITSTS